MSSDLPQSKEQPSYCNTSCSFPSCSVGLGSYNFVYETHHMFVYFGTNLSGIIPNLSAPLGAVQLVPRIGTANGSTPFWELAGGMIVHSSCSITNGDKRCPHRTTLGVVYGSSVAMPSSRNQLYSQPHPLELSCSLIRFHSV